MTARIAVVTGGTAGIGRSMAVAMAARGYQVHLVGTNEVRGATTVAEIESTGGTARFWREDLSSLHASASLAKRLDAAVPHVDVLANIAGVMLPERRETAEGLEMTLAVGHFSAYVLTRALVPAMTRATSARVVNVAGVPKAILKPMLDFDNLAFRQSYGGASAAFKTVHAKTVMSQVLAQPLKAHGIAINAFHPGLVRSDLIRAMPLTIRVVNRLVSPFLARRSIAGEHAAMADAAAGVTGAYFIKRRAVEMRFAQDYARRAAAWTNETVDGVLGPGALPELSA